MWGRVAPFLSPWCGKKDVPTGVNLNQYAGSRSCVPWHSGDESLFGPPNQPKLIVSLSLGNSVEFKVRRRAPRKVPSSIRLVWPNRSMNIARRLSCRVFGLTLPTAGWPNALRPVHWRSGLCTPNVCARFCRARFPLVGGRGK